MLRSWSPDAFVSHVVAGLIGLGAGVLLCRNQHRSAKEDNDTAEETPESSLRKECGWLAPLLYEKRYCHLEEVDSTYREWEDMAWRKSRGWMGQDFVHSKTSPGPRVLRYFYDRRTSSLIGIVKFGPGSESHAGLCHGGSMCAVLDDVVRYPYLPRSILKMVALSRNLKCTLLFFCQNQCGHTAFVANGTGPCKFSCVLSLSLSSLTMLFLLTHYQRERRDDQSKLPAEKACKSQSNIKSRWDCART